MSLPNRPHSLHPAVIVSLVLLLAMVLAGCDATPQHKLHALEQSYAGLQGVIRDPEVRPLLEDPTTLRTVYQANAEAKAAIDDARLAIAEDREIDAVFYIDRATGLIRVARTALQRE